MLQQPELHSVLVVHEAAQAQTSPPHEAMVFRFPISQTADEPPPPVPPEPPLPPTPPPLPPVPPPPPVPELVGAQRQYGAVQVPLQSAPLQLRASKPLLQRQLVPEQVLLTGHQFPPPQSTTSKADESPHAVVETQCQLGAAQLALAHETPAQVTAV